MSDGNVTPDGTGSVAPSTPPQWQLLQDKIKRTVSEVSDLRSKVFAKLQALRVAQFEMRDPVERMIEGIEFLRPFGR